jgi:hypothetical protein
MKTPRNRIDQAFQLFRDPDKWVGGDAMVRREFADGTQFEVQRIDGEFRPRVQVPGLADEDCGQQSFRTQEEAKDCALSYYLLQKVQQPLHPPAKNTGP